MCTNCGPLGLKGDQEPSTNRAALSGRSWAHIVHSNDDHRAKTDANRAASKEAKAKRRADKKAARGRKVWCLFLRRCLVS